MLIDISNISTDFKILTDSGYEDVIDVFVKEEECLEFHLSNWEIIKVAKNHLFEIKDNVWKFAEDFEIDDTLMVEDGLVTVINILDIGKQEVHDMTVDSDKHQYFANGISSHNSGKTLIAVSAGIKHMRTGNYDKITYIRNSVESTDKAEGIGFLPGLEEKFKIYNYPLFDTLEYIANKTNMKGTAKKEGSDVDERVYKLMEKHKIETLWNGAARGRTISNSYVIIDEVQNFSKSSLQTILSRIDKDCKVIMIGSNNQIDHPYINKHNNGLSVILESLFNDNPELNIHASKMDKVLRGNITEFAERVFSTN